MADLNEKNRLADVNLFSMAYKKDYTDNDLCFYDIIPNTFQNVHVYKITFHGMGEFKRFSSFNFNAHESVDVLMSIIRALSFILSALIPFRNGLIIVVLSAASYPGIPSKLRFLTSIYTYIYHLYIHITLLKYIYK